MKLRVRFSKYSSMKFIGHLDIMRFFQKLIRRANVDICYTEGFHPHQIMTFASPLGVGILSNGEYMDIVTEGKFCPDEVQRMLQQKTVEGIDILSVKELPEKAVNAMATVAFADYTIRFREGQNPSFVLKDTVSDFFNRPEILVEKQTKKGTRTLNLKEAVLSFEVTETPEGDVIFLRAKSGSSENIKPELVLEALFAFAEEEMVPFSYIVTREDMYDDQMISLGDISV